MLFGNSRLKISYIEIITKVKIENKLRSLLVGKDDEVAVIRVQIKYRKKKFKGNQIYAQQ